MFDDNLIHKALASPFRREVLKWLKAPAQYFAQSPLGPVGSMSQMGQIDLSRGVPVNSIHALSGLSQSTVSKHVAALVEAQLLVPTRVGQWLFLARNEAVIRDFATRISLHL